MNGNPPAAEFLKEFRLGHHGDFSAPSKRDALIYEKAQGQVQPGLVFGQIQPAQGLVMDGNQHRASLPAPMLTGKCGNMWKLISASELRGLIKPAGESSFMSSKLAIHSIMSGNDERRTFFFFKSRVAFCMLRG